MPEFKLHEAFSEPGAEEYKKKGNEAFQAQNWDEAIKNYNKAIQLDPNQAAFYSNRAACWSSKGKHDSALSDAKRCLDTDPNFIKGYSRKGKALFDLKKLDEAEAAYQDGLGIDPANAGCVGGLADVKRARAEASQSSSMFGNFGGFGGFGGGGGGGGGGGPGGIAGLGKKLMSTLQKGGLGGRMQMYMVAMVGYFLYNNFVGGGSRKSQSSSSSSSSSSDPTEEDGPAPAPGGTLGQAKRSFVRIDDTWVSYLETGSKSDSLLLLLHSTSLSAEAEYGQAIARVLDRAEGGTPRGGLRVLAPDRPCHGFSPCPGGKKGGAAWLDGLLAKNKAKKLTIVASGRTATRQALAVAKDRTQPSRLLLLNPRAAGPSRPAAADAAGLQRWLQEQKLHSAEGASVVAAADAARWLAAGGAGDGSEGEDEDKLAAAALPEGSQVTALYAEGEKEDPDLKEELEGAGLAVRSRFASAAPGSEELATAVATEAWRLVTGSDEETSEEV